MSEALIGTLIGGTLTLLGGLLAQIITVWRDEQKEKRERQSQLRARLFGERIQTSDVLDYINSQRPSISLFTLYDSIAQIFNAPDIDMRWSILPNVDLRGLRLDMLDFSMPTFVIQI